MTSFLQFIPLIAIVYSVHFSRRVVGIVQEGTINSEPLTGEEKLNVWLLALVNPVLHGAILYFTWRKKLPIKAKQANTASFIMFGIEMIIGLVLGYLLFTYGGTEMKAYHVVDCTISESSANSKEYNANDAACYIAQRTDASIEDATYVVNLMQQQLKELGLTEGGTPIVENPDVDPYAYVEEKNTRNFSKKQIEHMVDAEYHYNEFIGIIEKKYVGSPVSTFVANRNTMIDSDFIKATEDPQGRVLARGDLNHDGYEDAIVQEITCGASCGVNLAIVLSDEKHDLTKFHSGEKANFEPGYSGSGALKSEVTSVSIKNGIISLTGMGLDCQGICTEKEWRTVRTLKYVLDGDALVLY